MLVGTDSKVWGSRGGGWGRAVRRDFPFSPILLKHGTWLDTTVHIHCASGHLYRLGPYRALLSHTSRLRKLVRIATVVVTSRRGVSLMPWYDETIRRLRSRESNSSVLATVVARVIIDVRFNSRPTRLLTNGIVIGDGKQPKCQRCEHAKKECVYESGRRFRRSSISEAFSDTQPWVSLPPQSKSSRMSSVAATDTL
jgi:hypothetical protein